MENKNAKGSSSMFIGILTLMLVFAKILGFIDWHWFYVLLPVLIPWIIAIFVLLIGVLLSLGRGKWRG